MVFSSTNEAYQFAANLPVTVGYQNNRDGSVSYLGYVGDHYVGEFDTEQEAQIAAATYDRRKLCEEHM